MLVERSTLWSMTIVSRRLRNAYQINCGRTEHYLRVFEQTQVSSDNVVNFSTCTCNYILKRATLGTGMEFSRAIFLSCFFFVCLFVFLLPVREVKLLDSITHISNEECTCFVYRFHRISRLSRSSRYGEWYNN